MMRGVTIAVVVSAQVHTQYLGGIVFVAGPPAPVLTANTPQGRVGCQVARRLDMRGPRRVAQFPLATRLLFLQSVGIHSRGQS